MPYIKALPKKVLDWISCHICRQTTHEKKTEETATDCAHGPVELVSSPGSINEIKASMDAKSRHHRRTLGTNFGNSRALLDVYKYLWIGYEASQKIPHPSCSREPRLAAEFNSWKHSYRPRSREIRQKSTIKLTKLACTHTHPYLMLHTMRIDTLVGVSFPHWVLAIAERLASPLRVRSWIRFGG